VRRDFDECLRCRSSIFPDMPFSNSELSDMILQHGLGPARMRHETFSSILRFTLLAARWWACASSTCRPGGRPFAATYWQISAPTSSRSNCQARAIRSANWRRTKNDVPLMVEGHQPQQRRESHSICASRMHALLARLLADRDVLREFFVPARSTSGASAGVAAGDQPRLTILRVTGFGQTGLIATVPALHGSSRR